MRPIFHRMGLTELIFGSLTRTGGASLWSKLLTGSGLMEEARSFGYPDASRLSFVYIHIFIHQLERYPITITADTSIPAAQDCDPVRYIPNFLPQTPKFLFQLDEYCASQTEARSGDLADWTVP